MTQSDIINNNFSKAFECIKCSNAYDTGEVLSEEKLFKQISERKHSTFDLSKFTVVGSPTITDDGVASGFSTDNYLKCLTNFDFSKNFSIECLFTTGDDTTTEQHLWETIVGRGINLQVKNNKFALAVGDGTNWISVSSSNSNVTANTSYKAKVIHTLTGYKLYINEVEEINIPTITTVPTQDLYICRNGYFVGSIDLKHFSITVDGKEVLSGNKTGIDVINDIEIPYTLSKTGSKIVDVAYRDRVIDLYEQQGHARYYTIDEENKNFTLPMGEIYGMIGGSSSTGGSGLELCDIGMALYVDETKGLRRYLNGQIVDRNTNTEAFFTRLQEITTLYPSLLCTEEEWQTAKTMSAFGQVGKFVFNYSGDEVVSVRIPRVVNVQGLFDLQNLGMTVDESLPNITGRAAVTLGGSIIADGAFGKSTDLSVMSTGSNQGNWTSLNINASRSSSTYQDGAPVQQEAIQYPYFIQIATGSETENNIINEIELNNPYSLFDSKYSDHKLNNLSWLKSEGQWNAKAVYTDAYDELLREYNDSTSVEETEGSITFKRTPKGYKIALADQETAIDTKYTTDGIAWYYILDTTNEKFKLPRTKFGFEGLRTNVGDDIKAGLPNITGTAQTAPGRAAYVANGALAMHATQNATNVYGTGPMATSTQYGISLDASRSNPIYGNSDTVQPPATQMYLYFYVGETVQNANLIDAGRLLEILPAKLDKLQIPIGQPQITLSNTLEDNEIWLEGATVSRTTYAELFKIYGTTYGTGDGSTTFVLPNFKNRAIWGSNEFGYIEAGLPNITGSFTSDDTGGNPAGAFYVSGYPTGDGGNGGGWRINLDASRSSSIYGKSSTVQPPAIKVRVKTRYK